MGFWHAVLYLLSISIAAFFVGRLLPKRWFSGDCFPFRAFAWERGGRVYEQLHIKAWQNRLPDMSRLLPALMPAKRLEDDFETQLPRMIQETCVAEETHVLLILGGLVCPTLWPGAGGLTLALLYGAGNLPYILIQRYNRPRLMRLQSRMDEKTVSERQTG